MATRNSKLENVLKMTSECLASGKYIYVGHAQQRLQEREVTRLEVKQVLKTGYHEKEKMSLKKTIRLGTTLFVAKLLIRKNFEWQSHLIKTTCLSSLLLI